MRYLAFDLGSSFIKGAVLDLDACRLSHSVRLPFPEPLALREPTFKEFDPLAILATTELLLQQLLRLAPDAQAIVMSSQLHSLVLTDVAGNPLGNAINWQDQRALLPMPETGGSYFDEINRRITPQERRETGNEPRPGVPLCFLFWLAQEGRLPRVPAIPCSLAHFIAARLCHTSPKTEITHAFAHGALNVETHTWHQGVIRRLGLEELLWPAILPQQEQIGEWAAAGRSLPFFAPTGDYHCSQVGSFLEAGELSVNISTGSAVIQLAEALEFGDFQTRPWFDGRYLKTITHIPGGRALNALVRLLGELASAQGLALADPWDYILAEAEKTHPSSLRVNPAFYFSAMGSEGSLTHVKEENLNIGQLFRATFAGMADNYAACAQRIAPRRDWTRLVFSGGVALKTPLLRRLICDRLGETHRLAAAEEDVLLGLLVLALRFSGRSSSVRQAMDHVRQRT